jgi:uncharacterized protein YkwD
MDVVEEGGCANREGARRRALSLQFRRVALLALAASLGACGGGGGGSGDAPPPAPVPAPTPAPSPSAPIAAQLTVPTPTGYDADRLAAFDRLNQIRLSAGLGMLAQNASLDQAAQAHADWMVANDSFEHEETAGTPGFTGAHWWLRAEALGYVPVGGEEVMSSGAATGAAAVDSLVNTLYHRAGMLAFEPVDVGVGWSSAKATNVSTPLVIDLTRPGTDATRALGQTAQSWIQGVAIWPLDGASGVPTHLGLESPNPVPSQDVSTLGTPASLTMDPDQTIQAISFIMTNAATGAVVPTSLITNQNDTTQLIPPSFMAIVPLVALTPNALYRVTFSGQSVAFPSGAVTPIDRSWSFTTASP